MSEDRPRPQYGEYATPEEQRARISQPAATSELESGHHLGGAAPTDGPGASPLATPPVASPQFAPGAQFSPAGQSDPDAAPSPMRYRDRVATIALLAYGLFNVVSSVVTLSDYTAYANSVLALIGVDATFTDEAGARPWALAASAVLVIGWIVVALISWASVRRGRLTWWIPLVGGIVCNVASASLMMVPLLSDPTIVNAILATAR